MGRVVVLTILTIGIIFLVYKKDKNLQKAIISTLIFGYILLVGYSGFILTRAIRVLFFIDIITLIASYFALMIYIFKRKLLWYILILPALCIALYFGLDFLDGSRYEK